MSRAVELPQIELRIGGTPVAAELLRSLSELRVQQRLSQPSQGELLFLAPSSDLPQVPGGEIEVCIGGVTLFSGDIAAVEHCYTALNGRELKIRCYDRLQRLRKRQVVRSYIDIRVDELARELVLADGIEVQSAEVCPILRHLVQWRRSDFDLLADFTQRFGLCFWLDGRVLRLRPLTASAPAVTTLKFGSNLFRAEFEFNGDAARSRVRTAAWDPAFSATRGGEACATGAMVPDRSPEELLVNRIVNDDTQAQLTAQSELDRRNARRQIFSGVAEGDTNLQPGLCVDVQGVVLN